MIKLERITEETLTPEHVERVRRAVLGIPRKNAIHRAILTDCASVLDGNTAARETVVRAWNLMVTPIGERIENSSMGAAVRDIKERSLDAHLTSKTRVDVVCESCQAPIGVSCTCPLTSDCNHEEVFTSDPASRIDVACESCQAPIGVACTCADGALT